MATKKDGTGALPMKRKDLIRYADEVIAAVREGDGDAEHAFEHLRGLILVTEPGYDGYDSARVSMLYFIANYTWWAREERDSTDGELAAVERLTDGDALALAVHVRGRLVDQAAECVRDLSTPEHPHR